MKDYRLSDDLTYLDYVQNRLIKDFRNKVRDGLINGFCMIAKTETWWSGAHSKDFVFNPKFKMTKNEDELQGRWLKMGKKIVICPSSFVWHYRGVTRNSIKGSQGKGWFRRIF
jgi:GT2 family glycosyltransferase